MSKDSVVVSASLSALETEAIMHFSLIVRMCGYVKGRFSVLKVHQATDGQDDTKRVRIHTSFDGRHIEGVIVLKRVDWQWVLYRSVSDINFGRSDHVDFWYDTSTHTYHLRHHLCAGIIEHSSVNMHTGERKGWSETGRL
jgi:hypothetical protein